MGTLICFYPSHYAYEPTLDRLRWYCRSGAHDKPTLIREEIFHVTDLGTQLKPLIQAWQADPELRRCKECGVIAEPK
jgi:3-hydroxyanthranilate 3,4-dioxygenase